MESGSPTGSLSQQVVVRAVCWGWWSGRFVRFVRSGFVSEVFFASFGESRWLVASEDFLILRTIGEGLLKPTAPFESSGGGC